MDTIDSGQQYPESNRHFPLYDDEVNVDGTVFPKSVTRECLDALRVYDVREDDVWILTYPKAGTHWVSEIVNLIFVDGYPDKIDRTQESIPMEFAGDPPNQTFLLPPGEPKVAWYKWVEKWKSPRVIVTHLHERNLPRQICEGKGRVIHVMRNPKDTAVSYWHFRQKRDPDPRLRDWNTYFDQFCSKDKARFGSWFSHTLEYWNKHRHDKNFIFVQYEEMKKDPRQTVIQIANFLKCSLADEAVDRVVKNSTAESMKQRYYSIDENATDQWKAKKIGASNLLRKGIVGDWKTQFTVAQNENFDEIFRQKMKGSGINVTFEL